MGIMVMCAHVERPRNRFRMNWTGLNFVLYAQRRGREYCKRYHTFRGVGFRKTLKRKKNDLIFFLSLSVSRRPYVNGAARENTRHGPCGARENLNSLALCMTETIQSFKSRYDSPAHVSLRPLDKYIYIYIYKCEYYNILRGRRDDVCEWIGEWVGGHGSKVPRKYPKIILFVLTLQANYVALFFFSLRLPLAGASHRFNTRMARFSIALERSHVYMTLNNNNNNNNKKPNKRVFYINRLVVFREKFPKPSNTLFSTEAECQKYTFTNIYIY